MKLRARIDLHATSDGGLAAQVPSPCQSLLLRVDGSQPHDEELYLGAHIATTSDDALQPGATDVVVDLRLLSDRADLHLVPGATFTLCHPLQVVGRGRVLEILPE